MSKEREQIRAKKRKRSASSIGREGENRAAEFLSELAPCKRIKRPDYGISDMDLSLMDLGPVMLLFEIKTDKAKWSLTYQKILEQADSYTENRREEKPIIPAALMQLRQGSGRPWKRMVAIEANYFRDLIQALQAKGG